jgi:hypothetical protein
MGEFGNSIPVNNKLVAGKIAELLERNGIDAEEVGAIQRISVYQNITKNELGEAETHDLIGIQLSPKWAEGPTWNPVVQGPPIVVRSPKATGVAPTDLKTAVILPDMQIGYFRNSNGDYEPIHDEDAIAVALKIVKQTRPSQVIMVGDNLDLCEFGKYRSTPAFKFTTQAAIDRATTLCAEVRAAAPDAEIVWLAGNHEERLPNFILDNASAAFGLRQGNSPESFPVMSVPFLCRFDEFGIVYKPGYPAGNHWITERLRVIHGNKVASGGSTAHKYLATEKSSVIYGHIHRREWAERTREDFDGPKTILAASPGCLARVDGVVPSTKGGFDLDGRPMPIVEDWQQGLAVVPYNEETGEFWYEQVAIRNGNALWRGKLFSA